MLVAVIDLGTNTFHLLIAEVNRDGTWKKRLQKRITVKLGQGGIQKNIIARGAYRRGINAVKRFRSYIKKYKVQRVYTFGTAALRTASNGAEFLRELRNSYKIRVNVIPGNEEAQLIYYGVRQAVKMGTLPSLIMDIGGGSVEFIIASEKKIFWKQSYKLGAALLLGKFKPSDPLTKRETADISKYITEGLESLFAACNKFQPQQLIGSAGSFETFASMMRFRYPGAGSHYGKTELPLSVAHFKKLYRELLTSDREERLQMKGLIKMRVDMIVLAAILLKSVLDETKIPKMHLSAYSLKEGALWKVIHERRNSK